MDHITWRTCDTTGRLVLQLAWLAQANGSNVSSPASQDLRRGVGSMGDDDVIGWHSQRMVASAVPFNNWQIGDVRICAHHWLRKSDVILMNFIGGGRGSANASKNPHHEAWVAYLPKHDHFWGWIKLSYRVGKRHWIKRTAWVVTRVEECSARPYFFFIFPKCAITHFFRIFRQKYALFLLRNRLFF